MSGATAGGGRDLTFGWESCPKHSFVLRPPSSSECLICDEIRAAVEAEGERIAKINPLFVSCPMCYAKSGTLCKKIGATPSATTTLLKHEGRWRAAIQQALTDGDA